MNYKKYTLNLLLFVVSVYSSIVWGDSYSSTVYQHSTSILSFGLDGICIVYCDKTEHKIITVTDTKPEPESIESKISRIKPAEPNRMKLGVSGDFASAGLTELYPGENIFVTARHVLQSYPYYDLENIFTSKDLRLSDYSVLTFQSLSGKKLDIVVLIPNESVEDYIRINGDGSYSLQDNFKYTPKIMDFYFSYQLAVKEQGSTADQWSFGMVIANEGDHGYLPLATASNSNFNNSGPASSGSLLYFLNTNIDNENADSENWVTGGIIECVIDNYTDDNGKPVKGSQRFIPFSALNHSRITKISVQELLAEPRPRIEKKPGVCIPTDGKGAGGALIDSSGTNSVD